MNLHSIHNKHKEMNRLQRFNHPLFASNIASLRETERILEKQFAETDRLMKESSANFDREMKELRQELGSIGNNNGELAEEYFFNTFRKDKTFANETFEKVLRNRMIKNGKWNAEFDIVLINDKSVAIIEVKYRATTVNINVDKLISRIKPFKVLFPECENHNIYLGVAAMSFQKKFAQQLRNEGIVTIHQVGKKMVVYDKALKAFV